MKRLSFFIGALLSLTACASEPNFLARPILPYPTWRIALAAPKHMEVWVETVDVLDKKGRFYKHVFGGVVSYTGRADGWHNGGGKTKPVNNVDLPDGVFVRWQSLVEPQTYKLNIKIPQWVRDEMLKPTHMYCAPARRDMTLYPHTLTLGMAPGGIVKVWLGAGCLGYKEIGRYQAEVEPLGPHRNGNGIYYRAPTPASQAYIEQNGIPYGTW